MAAPQWRAVEGYEGCYEVSNAGQVRSLDRIVTMKDGTERLTKGRVLRTFQYNGDGHYLSVTLSKGGKAKKVSIHRLVATAFIPNPDNLPEINHKDENKQNNSADNLEWCDRQYNNTYGTAKLRAAVTQGKSVLQKKDGKIINAWPSEGLAAAFTGATQSGISACCRGVGKTSGGYEWEYAPWVE